MKNFRSLKLIGFGTKCFAHTWEHDFFGMILQNHYDTYFGYLLFDRNHYFVDTPTLETRVHDYLSEHIDRNIVIASHIPKGDTLKEQNKYYKWFFINHHSVIKRGKTRLSFDSLRCFSNFIGEIEISI